MLRRRRLAQKPIELIDSSGLLYFLQQVGVKARILFPEDGSGASG
jgi:hypothetical protein